MLAIQLLGTPLILQDDQPLAITRKKSRTLVYYLAAQIRLWLAPLLPLVEARAQLAEARAIAESGGQKRLLKEIAMAEREAMDGQSS